MPKAFWKGVISFGMVAIPVKMQVAIESKVLSFHLLHKKCLTRPKQVLYCEKDDEYFNIKETVRGYEFTRDKYVVLDNSDFNKVPLRTAHTINISGFVDAREIDPIYYYGSHYLVPEELGAKPFRLLRESLEKTGLVGIAKVAFQRREHLVSLRPLEDILVMHTLHYKSEVLPREEIKIPKTEVSREEMEMAISLVRTMSRSFKPAEYTDGYQEALEKIVKAKISGEKILVPEKPKIEIGDLMEALRASIEAASKEPAAK